MASVLQTPSMLQRWKGAGGQVVDAIRNASSRTGVSFDYLMNKAKQESSFNPTAKAGTSSASGLFQFIESTWLHAVKAYGDQFGIGHLANKISSDGKVSDPVARQDILKLRDDPEMASNMVAAMTRDNAEYLQDSLGGKVGQNELYMAHFLGLGGANTFLKARQNNSIQAAADLFPAAAKANKNVFYDVSGRKRSLDDVYKFFASKMNPDSGDKPVTLVAASGRRAPDIGGVSISSSGRNLNAARDPVATTGQLELLAATKWGERQMLETLLSGVTNFHGERDVTGARNDGSLLSPYTAFVLAKLQAPGDVHDTDDAKSNTMTLNAAVV